ncbi:MAG: hypothetical protein ACE5ER_08095 [Nitrospinaceae bacterium]
MLRRAQHDSLVGHSEFTDALTTGEIRQKTQDLYNATLDTFLN